VDIVNEVMKLSFPSVSGNSPTDDLLIISFSGSSKLPEVGSRLKQNSYRWWSGVCVHLSCPVCTECVPVLKIAFRGSLEIIKCTKIWSSELE